MEKNICLIGLGRWGKNIFNTIYKLDALYAVCEMNIDLLNQYKKLYGENLIYLNDINEIKNHNKIKAVIIATPAVTHYDVCKKCLLMNKDVLVEKPFVLKYTDGEELCDIARLKEKILMVGHLMQYHPYIKTIQDLLKTNTLGKILYIKSNRLNLGQLRYDENVLWSFAPHDISIILSLLNHKDLIKMSCNGLSLLNKPIADITTTKFYFKDNQYAEINVNWLYPFKEQSLIIVCEYGMLYFKDDRVNPELIYYKNPIKYSVVNSLNDNVEKIKINVDISTTPLEHELIHFIHCIKTRETPLTDGRFEGLPVVKILEQSQKELEKNQEDLEKEDVEKEDLEKEDLEKNEYENVFIHPSAIIGKNVKIGKGTKIWHNTHIVDDVVLGENCNIGQGVYIGKGVKMGNNCKVQNNVNIYSGVECEDGVFFGPNCTTTNDKTPRALYPKNGKYIKTIIKKGATIGAGAVIVCGIELGIECMIGAGSVVCKNVPDRMLVVGNPAKIIGIVDEYGNKMEDKYMM